MKLLMDMAMALKVIPRLCHTFKITNLNLMPYSYAIAHDRVCSDLQTEIDLSMYKSENTFNIRSEKPNTLIYYTIF